MLLQGRGCSGCAAAEITVDNVRTEAPSLPFAEKVNPALLCTTMLLASCTVVLAPLVLIPVPLLFIDDLSTVTSSVAPEVAKTPSLVLPATVVSLITTPTMPLPVLFAAIPRLLFLTVLPEIVAMAEALLVGVMLIPPVPLSKMPDRVTSISEFPVGSKSMRFWVKPKTFAASTRRVPLCRKRIPLSPVAAPLIDSPRMVTLTPAAFTVRPFTPEAKIDPKVPVQSIVIDLAMVTAPNPPGSRQLISPLAAVFEIAPAKVLQGAVRLHGLTSSPTPGTHVRVACALAA